MAPLSLDSVTSIIPKGKYEKSFEIYFVQTFGNTKTGQFKPWENHIMIILAMFFGSLSVASSTLTFYWFFRMRRSFRHDLIMLLITSEMFKSIWSMTYPVVFLSSGTVRSQSAFCQISGFFLTTSMTQSDIAILIIAVHTALFIFKNTQLKTVEGLYPYRRVAYIIWCTVPIFLASLAYIGSRHPYIIDGPFCCLPIRPFWYGVALGWVPRYFVFLFILGTYCSIYFYARKMLKGSAQNFMEIPRLNMRYSDPQPLSRISHGLKTRPASASGNETKNKRSISESNQSKNLDLNSACVVAAKILARADANSSLNHTRSIKVHSYRKPIPLFHLPTQIPVTLSTSHQTSTISEISSDVVETSCSRLDLFVCRSSSASERPSIQPCSDVGSSKALLTYPEMNNLSTSGPIFWHPNLKEQLSERTEMTARREQIQRKLLSLFTYPIAYVIMWLAPFIIHIVLLKDIYAVRTSYILIGIKTVSIFISAFVNCLLFLTREKPWRHIPAHNGSFWGSLKFWTCWDTRGNLSNYKNRHGKTGKTRDDMVSEARAAYLRRDNELAFQRSRLDKPKAVVKKPNKERSWWDDGELG